MLLFHYRRRVDVIQSLAEFVDLHDGLPGFDSVSATSLPAKKIEEGCDSISLFGEMLDLHLAVRSDPAPAAGQTDLAEQIRLDRHGIEASHVPGLIRTFDIELVGLTEHGSIIARPPFYVQREI